MNFETLQVENTDGVARVLLNRPEKANAMVEAMWHELREAMTRQLRNFLTVLFLPIFFTYTGLRTNIGTLESGTHWLFLLAVLGCAIFGKFGGCRSLPSSAGFRPVKHSASAR